MYTSLKLRGNILPMSLLASALAGGLAVLSLLVLPFEAGVQADMRISPASKAVTPGEDFVVEIIVESSVPVNVFAGELTFDSNTLRVESIDYNTSIADLWAEEPWYSNGDGTLSFAGGTTRGGGFTGTDSLIKVTFNAHTEGVGSLAITDAQILQHDGLGSEAQLAKPIDALFTVEAMPQRAQENLVARSVVPSAYAVVKTPPSTDLNGDGKQSIADVSILMINMGSKDPRFDFNLDGKVNLKDFNILLGTL